MPVQISGVLKDGTGKPIQNCTIQLKAKRNSSTVVVNTVASENPDEAGRYAMDVEYGQYSVILLVEGFPPSHAGSITVYEDSRPGTLNDFLGAMTDDDARPEALRRFELMVEEVARNASAVAQNTAAAKKSASDAAASEEAARLSEVNASSGAASAASSAKAASNSAKAAKTSETNAKSSETAAEQSASAAAGSETVAASSAREASIKADEAAASATAAGESAESAALSASAATTKAAEAAEQASAAAGSASAAKTSETNAEESEADALSSAKAAASSARSAASSASSASESKDESTRQASAAKNSATMASTKAEEAAGSATAAAQNKSAAESAATRAETAAKRAEDIASAVALEDASTTKKGIVLLCSATDSDSESLAATPKAVKAVNDNANSRVPSERKVNGKALKSDIRLAAADVSAFALGSSGVHAESEGGVPWNAKSGAYNVTRTGSSYIVANFYTGVGSCRTLQIRANYKNGGLFYRSSRDEYGFESDWTKVYTTKDSIPGVNAAGNQDTTGNAATASKLQTARKIAGVEFDGSADITLTADNVNAYTKTEVLNLLSSCVSNSSLTGYGGNLDIIVETLVVKSGGNGGFAIWDIGTTTIGANMYITPTPGINTVWRSTSSGRYKRDIETLDVQHANEILSLRPVWYRSVCKSDRKDWGYYGLIAEEVGDIAPQYVHWREPTKSDSPEEISSNGMVAEGVMYERLVVPLIHHVKKLTERVDELESKLNSSE
ncbi:prophage tail fiber N-terminal domain-containing protein [Citrobacter freundii]|uniref:prophage tail fiber N-terminal domain-containing protein n=1 Tax=Citrobacter freundii TaxID=546 RepID=UPI003AAB6BB4